MPDSGLTALILSFLKPFLLAFCLMVSKYLHPALGIISTLRAERRRQAVTSVMSPSFIRKEKPTCPEIGAALMSAHQISRSSKTKEVWETVTV